MINISSSFIVMARVSMGMACSGHIAHKFIPTYINIHIHIYRWNEMIHLRPELKENRKKTGCKWITYITLCCYSTTPYSTTNDDSYIHNNARRRYGSASYFSVWHYRIVDEIHNNNADSLLPSMFPFSCPIIALLMVIWLCKVTVRWPYPVFSITHLSVHSLINGVRSANIYFLVHVIG